MAIERVVSKYTGVYTDQQYLGRDGEIVVDLSTLQVYVHDGVTPGGIPITGGSGNGIPGGANGTIQWNNSGLFGGNSQLNWDGGNLQAPGANITYVYAGQVLTDNLLYANGQPWDFGTGGSGNYGNSNVAAFLAEFGSNIIATTGNISAGNVLTDAVESATDVFIFAANGLVDIRASGNVVVKSDNGGSDWVFDDAGVLTTPGDIDIGGRLTGTGQLNLEADNNPNAYIQLNDTGDSLFGAFGNLSLLTDGDSQEWVFGTDGALRLPGATAFMSASANFVGIYPDASPNNGIELYTTNTDIFNTGNVNIGANVAGAVKTWTFGDDGELTAPGNIATAGNVSASNLIGNIVSNLVRYEYHVSGTGNDTTGTGSSVNPYATIQHAVNQAASNGEKVVVHPGTYTENVVIGAQSNFSLVAAQSDPGSVPFINGNLNIANASTSIRVQGVSAANLTIATSGTVYLRQHRTQQNLVKSGSGYVEALDCDLAVTGSVSITGTGTVLVQVSKIANAVITNAGATFYAKDCIQVTNTQATAGIISTEGSLLYATTAGGNAIVASNAVVLLRSSSVLDTGLNPTKIGLIDCFYSVSDTLYDKDNTNFANASSLNSTTDFQVIRTDSLAASGNITANYYFGNGYYLTGIGGGSAYGNANVANYLASNANIDITINGNVTANYLIGNITGNITGNGVGYWTGNTSQADSIINVTHEPTGFPDPERVQSSISFNNSTRTFYIAPTGSNFSVWVRGQEFVVNSNVSYQVANTTQTNYIYYQTNGAIGSSTTYFDFANIAPVSIVYWNAEDGNASYFGDERHGTTMDWQTHEYLHRTRGAAYVTGFVISASTSGTGALNTDAQIGISSGTFYDEDIQVDVTASASPTVNTFEQDLALPAKIPVFYRSGTGWVRDTVTNYPFKFGSARTTYNLNTGGNWTTPDLGNGDYGVMFIVASNNLTYPVLSIMGQGSYNSLGQAEQVDWNELDLSALPVAELRPLYRICFQTSNSYSNAIKTRVRSVLDIRQEVSTQSVDGGAITAADIAFRETPTTVFANDPTANAAWQAWANSTITANLASVSGNIVPSSNGTYSLGNITNQWANLWLAGNTIYLGNVPLGIGAGNSLTVNSAAVVTANSTGNITTTGNITAAYFIGNIVGNITGNIQVTGSNQQVLFNSDGNIGATSGLVFDYATNAFSVGGNVSAGNLMISNDAVITGNLRVFGTTTTIDANTLVIGDLDIVIANGAQQASDANGAGILVGSSGQYASMIWRYAGNLWDFSGNIAGDVGYFDNLEVVGNITNLGNTNVTGNVTAANVVTSANITAGGNILAQNIRTVEGTVHVGQGAGLTNQGTYAIAMGRFAGSQNQGGAGLAIGQLAGQIDQGQTGVAIGFYAAANTQGGNAVAIGTYAGQTTQGAAAVAIGLRAGNVSQGAQSIAIGLSAGNSNQGTDAVAIGSSAGTQNQSEGAVAIGQSAGVINQGQYAVAVGSGAGYQNQANNSIAIAATGTQLSPEESGFYVDPVRYDTANISQVAFYNTNTKEFTYANSISIGGNITAGNILADGYFYANGDPFTGGNYGNSNVVSLLSSFGSNTVSTTGNVSAGNVNVATEVVVGNALSITNNRIDAVSQFVLATSNTATGNNSRILMDRNGDGVVVVLENTAGSGSWGLYQDNILFPDGSRQYSAYGNANVVANLAALGSNPITTTGNISAGNIIAQNLFGNVEAAGSDTEIQFNDNGALGGNAYLTYDKSANTLRVGYATGGAILTDDLTACLLITCYGNIFASGNVEIQNDYAGRNIVLQGDVEAAAGNVTANVITANIINSPSSLSIDDLTANSVSLANIADLIISGGTSGYAIITNGAGNLSWSALGGNSISNGTSNVTIPASGGAATFNINGSNVFSVGSDISGGRLDVNDGGQMYFNGDGTGLSISAGLNSGDPATIVSIGGNLNLVGAAGSGNILLTSRLVTVSGNLNATANVTVTRRIISTPQALSTLDPAAGARAFVNDANLAAAGNFGAQITGGGGNTVPVWSDGTNWYIG